MSSEGNEIRSTQNKIVKLLTTSNAAKIRIGPAGWSYTDWEGTVYPPHGSRFDPLAYLASFFDTMVTAGIYPKTLDYKAAYTLQFSNQK